MSWLNNSLNTIKGQLTTLAQEVLAETAGPGDDEYRGETASVTDSRTALELLADTQRDKEELDKLCSEKENEIISLRKQISEMQSKTSSDYAGGAAAATTTTTAGRTSKSPTDSSAVLEDSWCWEPENVKQDNDRSSDTSVSGNEMVNITLEDVPLEAHGKSSHRAEHTGSAEKSELQKRIFQLEEENRQLNLSLVELDTQNNVAMQNMLELKLSLQDKLKSVTSDYETLKKEQAEKFINGELELGKLRKQYDLLEKEHKTVVSHEEETKRKFEESAQELKRIVEEMADLQSLLEKKSQDNVELIQRVKDVENEAEQAEVARVEMLQKTEELMKELEEAKNLKKQKTSESSTSSTGKQSEDEFILVREGDANSSGPTTPPTKEELKDKIVQLEGRVAELTLENGSLSLKLEDRDLEKELAVNVLKDNLQELQKKYDEQEEKMKITKLEFEEQSEKIVDLRDKAADSILMGEKIKALEEEKSKIEIEINKMKDSLNNTSELERRLLLSEREKEGLQVELQSVRATQERIQELEGKVQSLTLENQQLKLNAEAETETLNNSAELEDKIKNLSIENDSLRLELEGVAQTKFQQAIAEEKKEITDLDADDDEPLNMDKLRELIDACVKGESDLAAVDSGDKVFKVLRERVWKVEALEKNLTQLSEEVIDLQDNKLVWDHEKKTLEADISQYIIQCDELMKNNEILLNELENYKRNKLETISEHNEENMLQLESQLEECNKLNRTLEEEYAELNEKIDDLEKEKQELTEQLRAAQNNNENLSTTEIDLTLQVETLRMEKCNLEMELSELRSSGLEDNKTSEALRESEEKCENLESQLQRLSKDHADLVAALQAQKASIGEATKKREETEKMLLEQESLVQELRAELKSIRVSREGEENKEKELSELQNQVTALKQELVANKIVADSLKNGIDTSDKKISHLTDITQELQVKLEASEKGRGNLIEELNVKETEAKDLKIALKDLQEVQTEFTMLTEEITKLQEYKEKLETDYANLESKYKQQTTEVEQLQAAAVTETTNSTDSESLTRIATLEAELLATADLQKTVDTLNYEKNEMIKALQQKHSENMQYYMEIQRLQPIVQQLQQQLTESKPCDKCVTLEATIVELRTEQEKQRDQINFLKEKSDILTTNLLTEQTNQKLIQQEKIEVEEQNASIRKDIERLREHLLEIEELHTQETVEMQRELDETKAKMVELQEDVSKSSNAYTSASIRANQHAETLQAQYALVVQQRDELVAKLSLAEDRESKNQAALCNLQCALEQFQNDKEHDISVATQRIRKELQQELNKEAQLQREIDGLHQQLADANQGLRAASRITDQLEACQQTIAALREEVETIKGQNATLHEQLKTSESSQSDKIEKSLIKSLLIGYVVSGNPNDKQQVLRMISSVLDFNAGESDKVGLNKQPTSWLGSILGGGGGNGATSGGTSGAAHSRENLVQAFVQFLEQESQPKVNTSNMPNLLNITQSSQSSIATPLPLAPTSTTTTSSTTPTTTANIDVSRHAPPTRRISATSNESGARTLTLTPTQTPIPIQPLLLNSNVLNEFAPTRNSSSILKDILSDS